MNLMNIYVVICFIIWTSLVLILFKHFLIHSRIIPIECAGRATPLLLSCTNIEYFKMKIEVIRTKSVFIQLFQCLGSF
jgi:hypothetical protein